MKLKSQVRGDCIDLPKQFETPLKSSNKLPTSTKPGEAGLLVTHYYGVNEL
jgi:hypothetical protein